MVVFSHFWTRARLCISVQTGELRQFFSFSRKRKRITLRTPNGLNRAAATRICGTATAFGYVQATEWIDASVRHGSDSFDAAIVDSLRSHRIVRHRLSNIFACVFFSFSLALVCYHAHWMTAHLPISYGYTCTYYTLHIRHMRFKHKSSMLLSVPYLFC